MIILWIILMWRLSGFRLISAWTSSAPTATTNSAVLSSAPLTALSMAFLIFPLKGLARGDNRVLLVHEPLPFQYLRGLVASPCAPLCDNPISRPREGGAGQVGRRIEPIIYGGGQQAGLRSGTVPVPLCVGMAAAAEIVGTPEGTHERERVGQQRDSFIEMLQGSGLPVAINGSVSSRRHAGNANLRFDGLVAQDLLGALQPRVAASTGAACTSGIPEPSHVLRAIGLDAAQAESSVRFSFGRFITDEEVEQAGRLACGLVRGRRQAHKRHDGELEHDRIREIDGITKSQEA